jgi:small-conductance mechanosensitive channel
LVRVLLCLSVFVLALVGASLEASAARGNKTKDAASDAALKDAAADAPADAAPDSPGEAGTVAAPDADDDADAAGGGAKTYISPPGTWLADGSVWPKPSTSAVAPSPAPSGSASAGADAAGGAPVRIHDRKVFVVRAARGGQSATERANNATQALEHAIDDTDSRTVRVEENGDVAIVFLGDSPIIQLGPDDAAADGDASISVNAAAVASKIQSAVAKERKRSALATTFFSISLLVFSALIVFLALGRLGALVNKVRAWIEAHPERLPNVRVAGIDVIRPAALRGGVLVAIDASTWVPVLIVFAIAGLAVALLIRFVALFFGSVARGETTLPWLPADLAPPASVLVRAGIVLVAVTFAAPLVTGSEEGSLARAGAIALIALGLSVTPLLATAAIGIAIVFGRKLRVGDFAEIGVRSGVIRSVSLLEVSLEDAVGCEIRVPHLFSLLHSTRVLGRHPPVVVEIVVAAGHPPAEVRAILEAQAKRVVERFSLSLDWVDATGAGYSVVVFSADPSIRSTLLAAFSDALVEGGIELGRRRAPP